MNKHKCFDCFYKTDWKDETHEFPICERGWLSYQEAKYECEKPGPCPHKVTHEELLTIIDKFNDIPN